MADAIYEGRHGELETLSEEDYADYAAEDYEDEEGELETQALETSEVDSENISDDIVESDESGDGGGSEEE